MKYILKKDLPDAKAGTIFELGLRDGDKRINMNILYNTDGWSGKGSYKKRYIIDFDEWFEEVKPREFLCCRNDDMDEREYNLYPSPEFDGCVSNWSKVIKVREVIEMEL